MPAWPEETIPFRTTPYNCQGRGQSPKTVCKLKHLIKGHLGYEGDWVGGVVTVIRNVIEESPGDAGSCMCHRSPCPLQLCPSRSSSALPCPRSLSLLRTGLPISPPPLSETQLFRSLSTSKPIVHDCIWQYWGEKVSTCGAHHPLPPQILHVSPLQVLKKPLQHANSIWPVILCNFFIHHAI